MILGKQQAQPPPQYERRTAPKAYNSYDFQFYVADYFTSGSIVRTLGTGFTLLDFNSSGKAMAIGKASEAEENKEADEKRKEEAETKNEAEQLVFQTEKAIKDLGDKADKKDVEEADVSEE